MSNSPSHRRPANVRARKPLPSEPLTVAEANELGWTRAARRHAVRRGDLDQLGRSVIAVPMDLDDDLAERRIRELALLRAAQASSLRCSRAVISHLPAAVGLGLPTYGDLDRPCLTVPPGTALRHLADAHLHRATLPPEDIVDLAGFNLTTPRRTILDVAREHGVPAGVVAADFALHEGLVDRQSLAAAYDLCAGWPGRRRARITLSFADGAAESPLESLSRLHIAAARLPRPALQAEICDLDGQYITRCDFYWDEFGVVGEADGMLKYRTDGERALTERATQKRLERCGLIAVRWGWPDLFAFDAVARQLTLSFGRGARRGSRDRRWGLVRPALHP
jgi:hypothetical protein